MRFGFVTLFAACLAVTAVAQDTSGSLTFSPLKLDGLVVGRRHVIDQAFAQKFDIAVPAGFEFIAPRRKQQKIYIKEAPGGGRHYQAVFHHPAGPGAIPHPVCALYHWHGVR